jgi:hypothetical protein
LVRKELVLVHKQEKRGRGLAHLGGIKEAEVGSAGTDGSAAGAGA